MIVEVKNIFCSLRTFLGHPVGLVTLLTFPHFVDDFSENVNPMISDMPSDTVQSTDAGLSTAVVTWIEPTANDNSGTVNLTSSHISGSTFSIGDTIVTYMAVDLSFNSANATFTITIQGGC